MPFSLDAVSAGTILSSKRFSSLCSNDRVLGNNAFLWISVLHRIVLKHFLVLVDYFSCVVRKPAFCICENKDADQLRGNREADQRLCFHYTDSTIPLLPKSKILRL